MNKKIAIRTLTALIVCIVFGTAFFVVPYVHKHDATQLVPLEDYDASCFFAKAEKNSVRAPSQQLVACVALLLLFTILLPFVGRRTETVILVRSVSTRTVQPPRAPPSH